MNVFRYFIWGDVVGRTLDVAVCLLIAHDPLVVAIRHAVCLQQHPLAAREQLVVLTQLAVLRGDRVDEARALVSERHEDLRAALRRARCRQSAVCRGDRGINVPVARRTNLRPAVAAADRRLRPRAARGLHRGGAASPLGYRARRLPVSVRERQLLLLGLPDVSLS